MESNTHLSELHQKLLRWSADASHFIADSLDACRPIVGDSPSSKLNANEREIFWKLIASCHVSSESVLLLVANQHLWDADILVRSVVEGTFKLTFLTLGTETERALKLHEFEECFFDMNLIKDHKRVENLLAAIPNPDAMEWRPFREMLLKPEELRKLEEKLPRKSRQQLDHKWSFGAICETFGKSDVKSLSGLQHLIFNYGMSSHFAHKDVIGIGMAWDRNNRNQARRDAVELAHGGRLISDTCVMALLRADMLHKQVEQNRAVLSPLFKRFEAMHNEIKVASERFDEVEYGNTTEKP